jgi:hypothetical protein
MLYIGIGETDSVILKHGAAPKQNLQLPDEMIVAYRNLDKQVEAAILNGQATDEDGRITDLPDGLQGLNANEIPEKLSKLRLKDEDEVMEEDEEYEEEEEVELSGDAMNNARVLVTEKNKYGLDL